ncbi:hypothetical protein Nmel_003983, partial [Mimus melanotis]
LLPLIVVGSRAPVGLLQHLEDRRPNGQVQRNSSFSTPGGCETRSVAFLSAWKSEGKVSSSSEKKMRCRSQISPLP